MIKQTSYHAADGDTRLGGGNESFWPKQERSDLIRGSSRARPMGPCYIQTPFVVEPFSGEGAAYVLLPAILRITLVRITPSQTN